MLALRNITFVQILFLSKFTETSQTSHKLFIQTQAIDILTYKNKHINALLHLFSNETALEKR